MGAFQVEPNDSLTIIWDKAVRSVKSDPFLSAGDDGWV
jgi:hypothetical protein